MKKRDKIIYWVATAWLSLGMLSTGIVQLIQMPEEVARTSEHLGFPVFLLTILGIWKIPGVLAILSPKLPILKEWAYAGFFFAMSGAVYAHIAVGDSATDLFGPVLLIVLTAVSWYLRPADRKLVTQ